MSRNKFTNWIEEEAVIFANIPARWHLIMLTFGVGMGVALALAIKFIR
jgi:hypothetical protein